MKKRIILVALLGLMVLMLAGCGKKINLNDYITYEITGYDGYAKLVSKFDYNSFEEDVLEYAKIDEDSKEYIRLATKLDSAYEYEWSKTKDLENGDKVTLHWKVKENALEKYKITLTAEDIKETVSGLQELDKFDPFENVELKFHGVWPYSEIEIKTDLKTPCDLVYSYDTAEFSNDPSKVIVRVETPDRSNIIDYCSAYGMLPSQTEKEYVVGTDVAHYATQLSDVPANVLQQMIDNAHSAALANINEFWNDPTGVEFEYIGMYIAYEKARSPYGDGIHNKIYIVDKVTVDKIGLTYYFTTEFRNGVVAADGNFEIDVFTSYPCGYISGSKGWFIFGNGRTFDYQGLSYCGCENLDIVYSECVTNNAENYYIATTLE